LARTEDSAHQAGEGEVGVAGGPVEAEAGAGYLHLRDLGVAGVSSSSIRRAGKAKVQSLVRSTTIRPVAGS
jgi:hypothetical protein